MEKKRPHSRKPKQREDLHKHAKQRARERFNLDLTNAQLSRAECDIRLAINNNTARASLMYRESASRQIYKVTIDGKQYPVVYNRKVRAITTFLLWEWAEYNAKTSAQVPDEKVKEGSEQDNEKGKGAPA